MQSTSISKNKLLLFVGLIGAIIVIPLVFFIYNMIKTAGKIEVTILSVPEDALIILNNTQTTTGTNYLDPGDYTLKAQKEGFTTYESKFTVEKERKTIIITLDPASATAEEWAMQNRQKYLELEGKAGIIANQEGENFRNKNPITNELPYRNFLYTVGYQNDPNDTSGQSIIVTIDASAGYRNAAVRKIRELGYDPTQLKIVFRNYESPFSHE